MKFWIVILAAFSIFTATNVAADIQWRIGANLVSYHVDPTMEFNEINPGAFVSLSFRDKETFQYGIQVGSYINSFNKKTRYTLGFMNVQVLELKRSHIRVGAFAGFFEYPDVSEKANQVGWPVIGDYVLAIGPSLTWRMDNGIDIILGLLPLYSKDVKGIFTLQTSFTF